MRLACHLTRPAGAAVVLAAFVASAARAEFPPAHTVTDPDNPALATRTTVSPLGMYRIVSRYYFDCRKRKWVLAAFAWEEKDTSAFSDDKFHPAETPTGQKDYRPAGELPSGPPPGSEIGTDRDRAFNPTTGQNFARENGKWIDVKTGKAVESADLCPCPEKPATTNPPTQKPAHHVRRGEDDPRYMEGYQTPSTTPKARSGTNSDEPPTPPPSDHTPSDGDHSSRTPNPYHSVPDVPNTSPKPP